MCVWFCLFCFWCVCLANSTLANIVLASVVATTVVLAIVVSEATVWGQHRGGVQSGPQTRRAQIQTAMESDIVVGLDPDPCGKQ